MSTRILWAIVSIVLVLSIILIAAISYRESVQQQTTQRLLDQGFLNAITQPSQNASSALTGGVGPPSNNAASSSTAKSSVQIASLIGGQTLAVGSNVSVHWNAIDFSTPKVGLFIESAQQIEAVLNVAQSSFVENTGEAAIQIGPATTPGEYTLKVGCDPVSSCPYQTSAPFAISAAPVE